LYTDEENHGNLRQLMVTLEDIKKDLSTWPDEVIDQWLIYFANENDMGWPPPDPLGKHRWGRILGGRPCSWWNEVSWKLAKVRCNPASLSQKSRGIVTEMIAAANADKLDASSKRRFDQAFHYILNNAAFPKPLITMLTSSGLSILDGSHRMGAFCALQMMPDAKFENLKMKKATPEQEVWVGTHSRGETPLS
jgi:hypothetical protein